MIVGATMDVYKAAMVTFLPTPAKSHYTFSLRDFSRVVNGVLLVPPARMNDPDKLIKLWTHETYRVFNDRLIDDVDRNNLFDLVKESCYQNFRQHLTRILADFVGEGEILCGEHIRNLIFGNYMEPDSDVKIYDEVTDLDQLTEMMMYYLNEYNLISRTPMNLVMFKFAIEHVSRVSRVLLQDNGHALLVGIGGSGRHSSVKLAASMSEYNLFEVSLFFIFIRKGVGVNCTSMAKLLPVGNVCRNL